MIEEDRGYFPSAPLDMEYDNNITEEKTTAIAIAIALNMALII